MRQIILIQCVKGKHTGGLGRHFFPGTHTQFLSSMTVVVNKIFSLYGPCPGFIFETSEKRNNQSSKVGKLTLTCCSTMSCNICVKDVAKSLTDPYNVMELINYLQCMCVHSCNYMNLCISSFTPQQSVLSECVRLKSRFLPVRVSNSSVSSVVSSV